MAKKQVLVRPRNRFISNTNNESNTPSSTEISEKIVAHSNAPLIYNVDTNLSTSVAANSETRSSANPTAPFSDDTLEEKPLDLTGIGTEIINDENLNSEVCYTENC